VVLGFLISNFFINKNSQGRKLSAKKIPTCGNSALDKLFKNPTSWIWMSRLGFSLSDEVSEHFHGVGPLSKILALRKNFNSL
jgi:hypothetical protein